MERFEHVEDIDDRLWGRRSRQIGGLIPLGFVTAMLAVVTLVLGAGAIYWHQEAATQQAQAQQLRQLADQESRQVRQAQQQISTLQHQNQDLQRSLASPTLSIWNSCGGPCTIGPDKVRVGGVPDTFQFHVTYTATVPVALYFMTFHQWTQYDSCGFQLSCVSGSYDSYSATTSRDMTFTKATGCAGYVFVLAANTNGTITPNVEATYHPADHPTGVCSGAP